MSQRVILWFSTLLSHCFHRQRNESARSGDCKRAGKNKTKRGKRNHEPLLELPPTPIPPDMPPPPNQIETKPPTSRMASPKPKNLPALLVDPATPDSAIPARRRKTMDGRSIKRPKLTGKAAKGNPELLLKASTASLVADALPSNNPPISFPGLKSVAMVEYHYTPPTHPIFNTPSPSMDLLDSEISVDVIVASSLEIPLPAQLQQEASVVPVKQQPPKRVIAMEPALDFYKMNKTLIEYVLHIKNCYPSAFAQYINDLNLTASKGENNIPHLGDENHQYIWNIILSEGNIYIDLKNDERAFSIMPFTVERSEMILFYSIWCSAREVKLDIDEENEIFLNKLKRLMAKVPIIELTEMPEERGARLLSLAPEVTSLQISYNIDHETIFNYFMANPKLNRFQYKPIEGENCDSFLNFFTQTKRDMASISFKRDTTISGRALLDFVEESKTYRTSSCELRTKEITIANDDLEVFKQKYNFKLDKDAEEKYLFFNLSEETNIMFMSTKITFVDDDAQSLL